MADPVATGMLGPLATHYYAGAPYDYAPARAAGKVLWETEVSDDKVNKNLDTTMDSGVRVAAMIHDNLVKGGVSAFHYWWLMPSGGGNGALTANNALLPRAYVIGNWSRFVRPGFVRVDATPAPQDSVNLTAFVDPAGTRVVLVAINQLTNERDQDFVDRGRQRRAVRAVGDGDGPEPGGPVAGAGDRRRVHVRVARAFGDDVRRRRHALICAIFVERARERLGAGGEGPARERLEVEQAGVAPPAGFLLLDREQAATCAWRAASTNGATPSQVARMRRTASTPRVVAVTELVPQRAPRRGDAVVPGHVVEPEQEVLRAASAGRRTSRAAAER